MYISYQMIMLRKKHLDRIISKEQKIKDAAFALDVRRETVSRWLAKYKYEGLDGIMPKKSGPKNGETWNRTSISELNYRLLLWLKYYNYNKKHGGLGMNRLTPVQKIAYSYITKSFTSKNVTGTLQQNTY